ncbi:MAG: hypothetical protein ACYDDO_13450 [Acidiferrobacterales bacterium]
MRQTTNHALISGILAIFAITWIPAVGAASSDDAPEPDAAVATPYHAHGTIDWIDTSTNTIIIDDRQLALSKSLQIHGGDGTTSKYSLQKGMRVGFNAAPVQDRRNFSGVITDVWVLP